MNDDARKKIFEEFKEMIRTETVVGQPIYLDDATIVPFVVAAVFYYVFNLLVAVIMDKVEKKLNYYR